MECCQGPATQHQTAPTRKRGDERPKRAGRVETGARGKLLREYGNPVHGVCADGGTPSAMRGVSQPLEWHSKARAAPVAGEATAGWVADAAAHRAGAYSTAERNLATVLGGHFKQAGCPNSGLYSSWPHGWHVVSPSPR